MTGGRHDLRRDEVTLRNYLLLITLIGLPVIAVSVPGLIHPHLAQSVFVVLLLTVMTIGGELAPVKVARGRQAGDEITVSSTFGMALLLIAPLGVVILVQAAGLFLDEIIRRRRWARLPFNIGQYALAFGSARAVLELTGFGDRSQAMVRPTTFLAAFALAGAVFFAVNNGLTGIAVALKLRAPILGQLADDVRWDAAVHLPLIGLAPVVIVILGWTTWGLIPLLAPIFAVHNSGRIAMRREYEALHDPLTGLPNRTLLNSTMDRLIAASATIPVALLLLDLDHFKEINDTLGHQAGDDVLQEVTTRLRAEVGDEGLVARLGGDEFAVLVPAGEAEAIALAERLALVLHRGYRVAGISIDVRASVGIGLAPTHAADSESLMRVTDVALYRAKVERGHWVLYDKSTDTHTLAKLALHLDLRRAVEAGTIRVAYQPQVDKDGELYGVECLARWHHPELGAVSPEVFIPIAESTGLIDELNRHVLGTACRQVSAWSAEGLDLVLAVNLSARQLTDTDLAGAVGRTLAEANFAADRLVLEVTEGSLMRDPARAAQVLSGVRELGVQVSIDDFGTGYSSLAYLTTLEVDELKIDRSFITNLLDDPRNGTIVRSTVALAHELGLRVVAEGVEDDGTLAVLSAWGCDVMQGFRIAPPMEPTALPSWERSRRAPVAAMEKLHLVSAQDSAHQAVG